MELRKITLTGRHKQRPAIPKSVASYVNGVAFRKEACCS
jgi:hypothetical protein